MNWNMNRASMAPHHGRKLHDCNGFARKDWIRREPSGSGAALFITRDTSSGFSDRLGPMTGRPNIALRAICSLRARCALLKLGANDQAETEMPSYHGSCHCGAVRFRIDAAIEELTTCDCSLCSRKNALMTKVHESELAVLD